MIYVQKMGQSTSTNIGYGIFLPNDVKCVKNDVGLDEDSIECPRYANAIMIGEKIINLDDYNLLLWGGDCHDGTQELYDKIFVLCRPVKYLENNENRSAILFIKDGNLMLKNIKQNANIHQLKQFCKDIKIQCKPQFIEFYE
jgi:hypothetical protein